jgi:hypothetical protein
MRGNLIICISKMATPRSLQFLYELCRRYHIKISILITGRHDIAEILLKIKSNFIIRLLCFYFPYIIRLCFYYPYIMRLCFYFLYIIRCAFFSLYNATVLLLSVYNTAVLLFSVYNATVLFIASNEGKFANLHI